MKNQGFVHYQLFFWIFHLSQFFCKWKKKKKKKEKPFWIWTVNAGVEIEAGDPSTNNLRAKLSVNPSVISRAKSPSVWVKAKRNHVSQ